MVLVLEIIIKIKKTIVKKYIHLPKSYDIFNQLFLDYSVNMTVRHGFNFVFLHRTDTYSWNI